MLDYLWILFYNLLIKVTIFCVVGNGNTLQNSCLGNLMDRGGCWAIAMGSQESGTIKQLNYHHHVLYLTSLKVLPAKCLFWNNIILDRILET